MGQCGYPNFAETLERKAYAIEVSGKRSKKTCNIYCLPRTGLSKTVHAATISDELG